MNCERHPDREAVAKCNECGAPICAECAEKTSVLRESCGTLCIDCCKSELQGIADYYAAKKSKRLRNMILMTVFYIIGIVLLAICGPVGGGGLVTAIIALAAVVCCGIGPLIWVANRHKEAHDAYEERNGVTYNVQSTWDGNVKVKRDKGDTSLGFLALIMMAFGILISPVVIIITLIGTVNAAKSAKLYNDYIATLQ